jgi:hypothetical protein
MNGVLIGGPYNGKIVEIPEYCPKILLMPEIMPYSLHVYARQEDGLYEYQGEQK